MVIKQFRNFTANKVFNQYKALIFIRALESRLFEILRHTEKFQWKLKTHKTISKSMKNYTCSFRLIQEMAFEISFRIGRLKLKWGKNYKKISKLTEHDNNLFR